jgi:hypothetical protein
MYTKIQVVFDAAEPEKLAEFWGLALGYVVEPPPEGFESWEAFAGSAGIPEDQWGGVASRVDPAGEGPRLYFQRVPDSSWKIAKMRNGVTNQSGNGCGDVATHRSLRGLGGLDGYVSGPRSCTSPVNIRFRSRIEQMPTAAAGHGKQPRGYGSSPYPA